jgi:hypothetical protein
MLRPEQHLSAATALAVTLLHNRCTPIRGTVDGGHGSPFRRAIRGMTHDTPFGADDLQPPTRRTRYTETPLAYGSMENAVGSARWSALTDVLHCCRHK